MISCMQRFARILVTAHLVFLGMVRVWGIHKERPRVVLPAILGIKKPHTKCVRYPTIRHKVGVYKKAKLHDR